MDNENELKDVIEDLNSRYIEITDFLKESENWVFNDEQKLITTQWLSLLKFYSAEFEDLNDEYECLNQQRKNQTYTNKLKRFLLFINGISPSESDLRSLESELDKLLENLQFQWMPSSCRMLVPPIITSIVKLPILKKYLKRRGISASKDNLCFSSGRELLESCLEARCNIHQTNSLITETDDLLSRLKQFKDKYDDIYDKKDEFVEKDSHNFSNGQKIEYNPWRSSVPSSVETIIYGRNHDETELVRLLRNEQVRKVIVLVGMGGLGKTTLVQKLMKNKEIKQFFSTQILVVVSDIFKVQKIAQDMLDYMVGSSYSFKCFSAIQEKLLEKLSGENLLLVLDDVWTENQIDCQCLGFLLKLGSDRSKILITARSVGVAEALYPTLDYKIYQLKPLIYGDSLKLFESRVFSTSIDRQKKPEFEDMIKDIVKKCNGLPLMICLIGNLLRDADGDKEKWREIITNSKEWKKDFVLDNYKISYDHLSWQQKKCFLYCSIFPKDRRIEKDELIGSWLAHGLIEDGNKKSLEEIEIECHDFLERRSLLILKYNLAWMHDLMYDLAEHIRHNEFICADIISNWVEPIVRRTFHLPLIPLEEKYRHLRVMICDQKIPNSVGYFKHLRFLSVHGQVNCFPKEICQLYHLQSLRVKFIIFSEFEFPRDIGNLKKLQHIYCSGGILNLTIGIGDLISLRTLRGKIQITRFGRYCTITELTTLSSLEGTLYINGLENIETIEEAKSARLESKENIKKLTFEWKFPRENQCPEIFDNLKPSENLVNLEIINYSCSRFPNWLSDGSYLTKLTILYLRLFSCEKLPILGKFPSLRHLIIIKFDNLKRIGGEIYDTVHPEDSFSSLQILDIQTMGNLEELNIDSRCRFPCLTELYLLNCPNLVVSNATHMLSKLKTLFVSNCRLVKKMCEEEAYTSLFYVKNLILHGKTISGKNPHFTISEEDMMSSNGGR